MKVGRGVVAGGVWGGSAGFERGVCEVFDGSKGGGGGWDPSRLVNHVDQSPPGSVRPGSSRTTAGRCLTRTSNVVGAGAVALVADTKGELKPPARGVQGEDKTPCTTLCRPG